MIKATYIDHMGDDLSVVNAARVSFGKKCVEKDNNVVYSYVWLYDKEAGLNANEKTCEKIKKN